MMELKEARETANKIRSLGYKETSNPYNVIIILDDRITELERDIKLLFQTIRRREANLNITEQRNRELEAQRDELLEAAMGVIRIVENAISSDCRGPNDQCSMLEKAIENATGKKWWDAIKQPALRADDPMDKEV